jgi:anti-sigma B factor antagonist
MIRDVVVLQPNPGQAVVELTGEHDLVTKDALRELLASLIAENDLVVVDLSAAEFIDSSVLHNLALADRLALEHGSHFRLQCDTEPIVRTALEISGLLSHLECVSDRESALRPT